MKPKKPSEWVWYQEYKQCSCTEIREKKQELTGHCPRHANNPRRTVKLPRGTMKAEDIGFCET